MEHFARFQSLDLSTRALGIHWRGSLWSNSCLRKTISWAPKSLQMATAAMKLKKTCSLEKKTMTNLDSVLKCRDITLLTKVLLTKIRLVEAVVFPLIMYGCESWTMKKAECQRIGAFELWCWRRLLRVPWTARRPSQSLLKKINPD